VFILKGGFLEKDTIEYMRKHLGNACFIYYNWDSFKNNQRGRNIYRFFDKKFSFDKDDCQRHNDLNYLPLFHSFGNKPPSLLQPKYDLLFVGSGTAERLEIIENIKNQAKMLKLNFKWHVTTGLPNYLWEALIKKNDMYKLSTWRTLDLGRYVNLLRQSRAVIDIENSGQSGLTIRTIETLSMGVKLITTNKNIEKEDFYIPKNMIVLNREKPIINPAFIRSDFEPMPKFYEKYSLRSWIKTLFGL
jgi:hypothetical protein